MRRTTFFGKIMKSSLISTTADYYREDGSSFLIKINAPVITSFYFSFQAPKKSPVRRERRVPWGGSRRARATGRDAGRQDPDSTEGPHLTLETPSKLWKSKIKPVTHITMIRTTDFFSSIYKKLSSACG